MRIDVLDADTLARVGWVDVWVSLYWDSPYYSEGSFTLEVRPTTENLQLLQEGRWLVRSDENPRIPMRICSRANQNEDANLVVSGYPATWLLTKRVSAVTVKNQNAESAMRSLVSAAKPWPRLALGTEYGFDTTFENRPPAARCSTTARPSGRPVIWGSASCWTARAAASACSSSASAPPSTQTAATVPSGAIC